MKTILVGEGPLSISLYADSAVGRDAQPLFIPELQGPWSLTLCLAFRVGRLGKSIPAKFAERYIDAMGIVALMHPEDCLPQAGSVPGWLSIMDSAVTAGKWLPAQLGAVADRCEEEQTRQALASASALATLKTGDVIIPPQSGEHTLRLEPNTIINASLLGEETLRLKVK